MDPYAIFRSEFSKSGDFDRKALEIFRYQHESNAVYREFSSRLGKDPDSVHKTSDIPFLPVSFFKSHEVISGKKSTDAITFTSSGTSQTGNSRHIVNDPAIYERSFLGGFSRFYGHPSDYVIVGLLPSYLERQGSSLIYMMKRLIEESSNSLSGFYLRNTEELLDTLGKARKSDRKILLLGVTYALLDLAEKNPTDLSGHIVVETGGMKGQRKEMIREEVHDILKTGLNIKSVHSEYGMTELLSQAWSRGNSIFECPPWMKVISRDAENPLEMAVAGRTGGLNIIDLANVHSCSFIATDDLGKVYEDGSFEVTGRFDQADVRGCNLLI